MKMIIYAVLTAGALAFAGCGESYRAFESDLTIQVSGSRDVKFKGTYSFTGTEGIPVPVNVEGSVPAAYKGKGITALGMFRNTGPSGALKVEVLKGNALLSSVETSAPYGIVILKKVPDGGSMINMIIGKILETLRI